MTISIGPAITPRRYDVDTYDHTPAAEYRQMWNTLGDLGYTDVSFYSRVMRACAEITEARRTEDTDVKEISLSHRT